MATETMYGKTQGVNVPGTDAAPFGGRVLTHRFGTVLVAMIDNPPVNAGAIGVRQGIIDALELAALDETVEAVVLIGNGTTFISGSDIREFGKPLDAPLVPAVISAIENCPKPVIAAIHGAALGGGYEIALGCDARIATSDAVVGLPEVSLGIIPGAGGTQRLPRLVGQRAAIDLIVSAKRVSAEEALTLGMIDALATGSLLSDACVLAHGRSGQKSLVRDREVAAEPEPWLTLAAAKAGKSLAASEAVAMILLASSLPIDQALAQEREVFERLRNGEEAAALRHLFFAARKAAHISGLETVKPRKIDSIGIVGAGTMGSTIAVAFLDAGLSVSLMDATEGALANGIGRIEEIYRIAVARGRVKADDARKRQNRLYPTTDLSRLSNCELLLEAVFEEFQVKSAVLKQLSSIAAPDCVIASNTSYLDLDKLANETGRPQDVVGLHFFSPANIMKLLEVVRGEKTSAEVLATALALAKRMGMIAIVAGVSEGFIGNRIFSAYRRQCEFMLEDGADPARIDAALEEFGFAMGPFAVADMSGLDIAWKTRQRLSSTRDPRERYVAIADRLCEEGRLGRKAGAGWYRYPLGSRRGDDAPEVARIIAECRTLAGRRQHAFSNQQIVGLALAAIVNEAGLVLSQGIAQRASDVDVALVNGYGFPAARGGPLYWAAKQPRREIEALLDEVETATGFGFRRANLDFLFQVVR